MRIHAHPCHCCAIHSDDLHHPNTERCDRFCTEHGEDKRCYHKPIITDTRIEQMKEEVDDLVQRLNQQVEQGVVEGSELTNEDPCNRDGREIARNDPSSIHFEPKSHLERIDFSRLINNELQLRQLPCEGRLLERTEQLCEYLKSEYKVRRLLKDLQVSARPQSALFLVMQTIPCILHMEMRVGLKIFTMILIEGLAEAKAGRLFQDQTSEGKRIKLFIAKVERIMN
jgi:hypothetical protein